MATGIVSLAADLVGLRWLAQGLLALNVALYAILWVLTALRFVLHRAAFLADLVDHLRGPGYFTMVAASAIVGGQLALLRDDEVAAWWLWAVALALWLLLTYTIFTAFTVKRSKPPLDRGIAGGWLLAVVATQSIAVLSTVLAARPGAAHALELDFLALSMWLWGGMLYVWMIALIFYRYTFFPLSPAELSPPYWINMGAMAISTLAGSLLVQDAAHAPFLRSIAPFVEGFTLLWWATGTWWIPILLVLGAWRHLFMRYPLAYDPLYWGMVFPLGMYAAATDEMARALDLAFLLPLVPVLFAVALGAWVTTFAGMLADVARHLHGVRGAAPR